MAFGGKFQTGGKTQLGYPTPGKGIFNPKNGFNLGFGRGYFKNLKPFKPQTGWGIFPLGPKNWGFFGPRKGV